jgi:hypothetical protein
VRARRTVAFVATLLFVCSAFAVSAADEATATSLKTQLRQARSQLSAARAELADLKAALRSAIAARDRTTQQSLAPRYHQLVQRTIPQLRKRVRRLEALVYRPMTPAPNGSWWRVIKAAALRHSLDPGSLQHMMMLESGGRPDCVSGPFIGLFQYCGAAWNGAWNPYRKFSIFNGGAQIWATATAIRRGYGPQMWPNTYPMSFGNAR